MLITDNETLWEWINNIVVDLGEVKKAVDEIQEVPLYIGSN